jgi:hypothetical protein
MKENESGKEKNKNKRSSLIFWWKRNQRINVTTGYQSKGKSSVWSVRLEASFTVI